jgi:hypothetical protein
MEPLAVSATKASLAPEVPAFAVARADFDWLHPVATIVAAGN